MSSLWSAFVIFLVVLNVGGCLWLIAWTMNMKTGEEDGDSTGHVWDSDLKEYNNPLPKWWLNTFYLTIIFTIVYLALYPGLGNFAGILGWTQTGAYQTEITEKQQQYAAIYAAFQDVPLDQLTANPDALRLGRNIFMNNCTACHGSDGRGAKSFPNLTDEHWLWGGEPAQVQQTIAAGRTGVMPALGAVVGPEGVEQITSFLLSEPGDTSAAVVAGQQKFMTSGCIGCHGINAEGNALLGAPNLRDDDWLHGSTRDDIRSVINIGRTNQMPAQLQALGDERVKLVAAYVLSLSKQE